MDNKELVKKAGMFGFSMSSAAENNIDANQILADMAKSMELSIWDGFPIVLANSAKQGLFDYEKLSNHFQNPQEKYLLRCLILLSFALYKCFNLKFYWSSRLIKKFPETDRAAFKEYLEKLKSDSEVNVAGRIMAGRMLKSVFENSLARVTRPNNEISFPDNGIDIEYSMSRIFSPKQKEIFFKKLKKERLTKTEKEYFSRVVKKKAIALADTELHNLARQLLK